MTMPTGDGTDLRPVFDREQQARSFAEARADRFERLVETLRRQRDHTAVLLLECEQKLAIALAGGGATEGAADVVQSEHDIVEVELREVVRQLEQENAELRQVVGNLEHMNADLRQVVGNLEHANADLRTSTSWRVTAPLRAVGRLRSRTQ